MEHHPILQARPEWRARPDLHRVIPLAIHGDGVSYVGIGKAGGKTLEVLSFCSLLAKGRTHLINFIMFMLVKSVIKTQGFGQSWPRAWKVLSWSFASLAEGLWPTVDFDGRAFPPDSLDFQHGGEPLADGFAGLIFLLKADLEFLSNHFQLESPGSNSPCCLCRADRDMQSKPWTDVRLGAEWRSTCWDRASWDAGHHRCHAFFKIPSISIDMVYPDMMHCKHLGTDQVLTASVITWLIKDFLRGSVSENLEYVWSSLKEWHKDVHDERAAQNSQRPTLFWSLFSLAFTRLA